MSRYLSVPALLLIASLAHADTTVVFTVAAGKIARKNEPVRVPLQLPEATPEYTRIDIEDENGKGIAEGQLTPPDLTTESVKAVKDRKRRDLVFVLEKLDAGKTVTLKAIITERPLPNNIFKIHDDNKWRDGKVPVVEYVAPKLDDSTPQKREETFKVFHHVYANGDLVTKGVGGLYTHHRGIFYGFMKVSYGKETVDIWHCKGDTHQAHKRAEAESSGKVMAYQRVIIDWNGTGKRTFAREERELTAYRPHEGTMIDFASKLTPTGDDVKLDGDPQHAGFHFRASNEVAERQAAFEKAMKIKDEAERKAALAKVKTDDLTIFIRPDGEGKPGTETNWPANKKHVDLPWLAMSFVVNGKRYTVCYLDLPTNPKEARFSERAYGRFGSYFVTTVAKDKPLVVKYRLWLQEGKMKAAEIEALSKMFREPVTVKVK